MLLALQKPVDQEVALSGVHIGDKPGHLLRVGQAAGDVEGGPPDECRVVAPIRRRHSKRPELGEDGPVYGVARFGQAVHRRTKGKGRPEHRRLALVPNHDRHVTRLVRNRDESVLVHGGHGFLVGLEQGAPRHVFTMTVGVTGKDGQLLRGTQRQHPGPWMHLDRINLRVARRTVRHPLFDPADQQPVIVRVPVQPFPTPMGRKTDALQQKQAVLGRGRKQTPSTGLTHKVVVVLVRLKPKQRKPEPVLPPRLSMATTGVAPGLCENRDDLVHEMHRLRPSRTLHLHRETRRQPGGVIARHNRGAAIPARTDSATLLNLDHALRLRGPTDLPRCVLKRVLRAHPGNLQLPHRTLALQPQPPGAGRGRISEIKPQFAHRGRRAGSLAGGGGLGRESPGRTGDSAEPPHQDRRRQGERCSGAGHPRWSVRAGGGHVQMSSLMGCQPSTRYWGRPARSGKVVCRSIPSQW